MPGTQGLFVASAALGLAIATAWLPALQLHAGRRVVWWPLALAIASGIALAAGSLQVTGLLIATAACVVPALRTWSSRPSVRRISTILGIAVAFALASRLFPGFPEVVLVDLVRLTPEAAPMRLTAHFDAGLAGLLLLAFYCRPASTWHELAPAVLPTVVIAVATTFVVTALACAVGYVRPEFKLPDFAGWHLAKILLWTCVLEEAFFRGVIQDGLARSAYITSRPRLRWLPLLATSILFGLAHAGGGPTFVALAALAGLGYGYAFQATGRIEAAIAVHFVLNATRFIGFTYPNLSGVSR